jgi:hypothetical protein
MMMMTDTPYFAPENTSPKESAQPNKTERAFIKLRVETAV